MERSQPLPKNTEQKDRVYIQESTLDQKKCRYKEQNQRPKERQITARMARFGLMHLKEIRRPRVTISKPEETTLESSSQPT
jgi:hypothetical protein